MWPVQQSAVGRIVVAPSVPRGRILYYTTSDFPGAIDENVARRLTGVVRDLAGIEATLNTCTQVHGATVKAAEHHNPWNECSSCDALWSDQHGIALGIKVADCLPVTLIDPAHDVMANIHSGWRGAVQRITGAAIDAVTAATAFDPSSSSAYLGPSIRVCCFEVGEEVVEQFSASYPDAAKYVDRSHAKPHVDIPGLTTQLLLRRGFAAENIHDSGLCTRCEGSIFHSFRRDGRGGGRNLAIVAQ